MRALFCFCPSLCPWRLSTRRLTHWIWSPPRLTETVILWETTPSVGFAGSCDCVVVETIRWVFVSILAQWETSGVLMRGKLWVQFCNCVAVIRRCFLLVLVVRRSRASRPCSTTSECGWQQDLKGRTVSQLSLHSTYLECLLTFLKCIFSEEEEMHFLSE